jgi:hypothetical protein
MMFESIRLLRHVGSDSNYFRERMDKVDVDELINRSVNSVRRFVLDC